MNEYIRAIVRLVALRAALKGTGLRPWELTPEAADSLVDGLGIDDACAEIEMVCRANSKLHPILTGGVSFDEIQGKA